MTTDYFKGFTLQESLDLAQLLTREELLLWHDMVDEAFYKRKTRQQILDSELDVGALVWHEVPYYYKLYKAKTKEDVIKIIRKKTRSYWRSMSTEELRKCI